MGWVSLLSGAFKFINWLTKQMARRQLIDQGRVRQIGRNNGKVLASAKKALAAKRAAPQYLAGQLPDDPDRRD